MRTTHAGVLAMLLAGASFATQLTQQAAAQQVPPDARQVPAKTIPVPDTVSPQMQAIIAQPYNPTWNVVPSTPAEWKAIVDKAAAGVVATLPAIREALGVTVEPTTIDGVKAISATPARPFSPTDHECLDKQDVFLGVWKNGEVVRLN